MSRLHHDPPPSPDRRSRRQILRVAALSAVGVGATALLAACGGSAAGTASTGSASTSAAAANAVQATTSAVSAVPPTPTLPPSAQVGSGTEIRWQFRGSPANLKDAQTALAQSFVPQNPNIKVTIEPAPSNRDEKLVAQMIAGTAPDVFESWSDNVQQFAEKGQVLNVDSLVSQNKMDISDFYAWQWRDFEIPINGGPKYGGSTIRFGLPKYVNVMFLWVNTDMFKQKGMALPTIDWNQDNYSNAMQQLTVKQGNKTKVYGAYIPMDSWDRFWYRVRMWGGHTVDPSDPAKCDLGMKEAQDAFEWARHLEWDLGSLVVATSGMPQVAGDRFFFGQYAIAEDGFYPFQMALNNQTAKINWQYAPIPKGPQNRTVLGTTDGFVQWKQSKHQDQAWTLMEYLSGPTYQEDQVSSTGLLPGRTSVLNKWKAICIKKYPELEQVNLDVGPQAMQQGYPANRKFFKNTTLAQQLIVPALQKIYDTPGTPVTYMQTIAQQINQQE